jgi:hypothetical protein
MSERLLNDTVFFLTTDHPGAPLHPDAQRAARKSTRVMTRYGPFGTGLGSSQRAVQRATCNMHACKARLAARHSVRKRSRHSRVLRTYAGPTADVSEGMAYRGRRTRYPEYPEYA